MPLELEFQINVLEFRLLIFHTSYDRVRRHFQREYGFANKQSERVLSILRKVDMLERYQPVNVVEKLDNLDFKHSEEVLNTEREKAYKYVNNAINSIKKNEKTIRCGKKYSGKWCY